MGQGTETCADRPTEVSVIRFVTRNRTIEEIAPKKEVYTCKQRGCGKVFTNQDEYKTHEALEALKIRFICREPGCGEELSDPGSMWRHYQEWHNNETSVYACPYTNCGSLHPTSSNLEEHIESCHRQLSTLPMEPEVICFEGPENTIDEEAAKKTDETCYEKLPSESFNRKDEYGSNDESCHMRNDAKLPAKSDFCHEQNKITAVANSEEYSNNESINGINKFSKNEDLLIIKDNFLRKYDGGAPKCEEILQVECSQDKSNMVYISGEVTITKNMKAEICNLNLRNQEHRIDLGNLERVFRSGLERENSSNIEESSLETNSNCSDDEEYTPKKQRMSRYKQETYKCDVNGCGKKYKYISHYRHHQDSHKLVTNTISSNTAKQMPKVKQGKASTVSFFICKMPGCGAQVNNVTGLWKHYQDNHANSKPPVVAPKNNEVFRCKVPGCEVEFNTTLMLYKHFNEVHSNSSIGNANGKTGNASSFHFTEVFQEDATTQQANFKTDFKAKHNVNLNDYTESGDEQSAHIANS
ncbi:zinc finger protein GLI1-like isoform X1 [Odontomachus brunneus]|uniref:zinc finger protein GLI1-like isoform X1 n=3 Tax=Odontomachus brunneus TaxID=486640 RepID=UPI0013F2A3ED|nr:zinc finger protein GLI1-like isoform X1 [Odontomachus brunneus]